MSSPDSSPDANDDEIKLEEEDPSDLATQRASETVSLDVASDSAQQRVDRASKQMEFNAERDAISNHRYCALINCFLLLVLLLSTHLSENAAVVSVPIVTTNWCSTLNCGFSLVETSFNTGNLSVVMLCVFIVENLICGFVIPYAYVRLARVRSNCIGAVADWIGLSMMHMQLAMLTGSVDPRTFCMLSLLMASLFVIVHMRAGARWVSVQLFCTVLVVVQWALFIIGACLQEVSTPWAWWLPFLIGLEGCYFWVMLWSTDNDWSTQDRRLLMCNTGLRACNTVWLSLVMIAA